MTVVNPNWPLIVTQFNTSDPFDPNATPSYAAFNPQPETATAAGGKQYELDLVQAGEATFKLFDQAETLNPKNPSGPWHGKLKPLRQIIDQAMWPPAPVGGAVNLLNSSAVPTGYDPSFENTAAGGTPPNLLTYATSPTVVAANPWQGTKSLQWSVTGNSSEQMAGFAITCIPGQQYTASAYVRQTAANTTLIFINDKAGGDQTTVTNGYVRLTTTFTATAPHHQLFIGSFSPTLAGTVNIDAVQLEPGASASAFSTSGPVIYGIFSGFIQRYPRNWMDGGVRGMCSLSCVDAFAILANQYLQTELYNSILAKAPDYYWPLSEPQGATTFGEVSGNNGPPMRKLERTSYSPANPPTTFTAGAQTNIPGDPGGTGLNVTGPVPSNTPNAPGTWAVARAGAPSGAPAINVPTGTAYTVCAWIAHTVDANNATTLLASNWGKTAFGLRVLNPGYWNPGDPAKIQWVGGNRLEFQDFWGDGLFHFYAVTVAVSGGNVTTTAYVDGNQVGTNTTAGTNLGFVQYLDVGGFLAAYDAAGELPTPNGVYEHVALWNRALSGSEITDVWNAGKWGYLNDSPGARIARYLSYNWIGPTAIDTGTSTMDVSNLAANTSILDACQSVATSENGRLFVDPNNLGAPTFFARTRQYYATTAKWVLGENTAAGELPYEEDFGTDFDDQQVYNDVQVTRAGGIVAVGGTPAAIVASRHAYGKRTAPARTVNITSDLETKDAADWIFAGHADAATRINAVTIKPSANPALWPMALGARQGDRVTVHRRTSAGFDMVADYFIERIEPSRKVSDTELEYTVKFQMSPASLNKQPGIFDDATYGRFDSTLIFGY